MARGLQPEFSSQGERRVSVGVATYPSGAPLKGRYVALRRLDPVADAASLWVAFSQPGPEMWTYLPFGPFADRPQLQENLQYHARRPDWVTYSIFPEGKDQAEGCASFMTIVLDRGSLEIGALRFGGSVRRSRAGTEAVYLMLEHAFACGFRRIEWKCETTNDASRRAAARLGFRFEGILRGWMHAKGRDWDMAWHAMLARDWPEHRDRLQAWLSPDNFDERGLQYRALKA